MWSTLFFRATGKNILKIKESYKRLLYKRKGKKERKEKTKKEKIQSRAEKCKVQSSLK